MFIIIDKYLFFLTANIYASIHILNKYIIILSWVWYIFLGPTYCDSIVSSKDCHEFNCTIIWTNLYNKISKQ